MLLYNLRQKLSLLTEIKVKTAHK